ncbi:MAG: penicillin-binding protein 2, partial [Bacteroidota bacterium]
MPAFNQSRQNFIRILFLLAFIVLVLRLLFLQLGSKKYDLLALDNAVSKKIIYPDRGIIFDRKGKSILENTLTYDLMINPTQLKGMDTLGLCKILNISVEDFKDRVVGAIVKNGRYRPSVFEGSLAIETFVQLQENIFRFEPGFFLQERPIRSYPFKAAAHILGYVGEVDSNILKRTNYYYQMGDYMGLSGLERYYENILMGQRGVRYQIKDNKNRIVGSYEKGMYDSVAIAGRNLNTYIDIDVQVLAERLLKNKLG